MSNHRNKFPALSDKISAYYYKTENLLSEATSRDYYSLASRIVYRTKCGIIVCKEYDSNDLLVHCYNNTDETEYWYGYTVTGDKIYHKSYNNEEVWYDVDGKRISKETYIENHRNDTHPRCTFDGDTVWWNEYDTQGNLVYTIDRDRSREHWTEYDSNNNPICHKDSTGYKTWKEYDKNNNMIHSTDNRGYHWWYEYAENGQCIHYWDSVHDETETWYDSSGKKITEDEYKKLHNDKFVCTHYNTDGNINYREEANGTRHWYRYNKGNNLIWHKISTGYTSNREYDNDDNMIHYKNSEGLEYWCEHDTVGNIIHYWDNGGNHTWYGSDGNVISKEEYNSNPIWNNKEGVSWQVFTDSDGNCRPVTEMDKLIHEFQVAEIKKAFSVGDLIVNIPDGKRYLVYADAEGNYQPFTDLNDYDPKHYMLAADRERIVKDSDTTDGLQRYNDAAVDELFNRFNHTSSVTDIPTPMKTVGNLTLKKYTYTTLDNGIIKGEMKSTENDDITTVWAKVDENGNVISFKNSDGTSGNNTYDDNGNLIFSTSSDGYTEWNTYDDQNRLVQKIHTQKD